MRCRDIDASQHVFQNTQARAVVVAVPRGIECFFQAVGTEIGLVDLEGRM
jgi:hypothetical protein